MQSSGGYRVEIGPTRFPRFLVDGAMHSILPGGECVLSVVYLRHGNI